MERLPAKVNKPQGTATLELWVLYHQLKLEAATVGKEHSALSYNSCTTSQLPKQTTQPHTLLSPYYAAQDCNAELAQDPAEATNTMPAASFPRAAAQSVLNSAGSCSQEAAQVSHMIPGHKQEVMPLLSSKAPVFVCIWDTLLQSCGAKTGACNHTEMAVVAF